MNPFKPHTTKGFTILVIEDDPNHQDIIQRSLAQSFGESQLVLMDNPENALTYLTQCFDLGMNAPDLILLDLYLPRREKGLGLLKSVRSLPTLLGKTPIIILSLSEQPLDIRASYDYGVSSYIIKPQTMQEWGRYFQNLRQFWVNTATLPS